MPLVGRPNAACSSAAGRLAGSTMWSRRASNSAQAVCPIHATNTRAPSAGAASLGTRPVPVTAAARRESAPWRDASDEGDGADRLAEEAAGSRDRGRATASTVALLESPLEGEIRSGIAVAPGAAWGKTRYPACSKSTPGLLLRPPSSAATRTMTASLQLAVAPETAPAADEKVHEAGAVGALSVPRTAGSAQHHGREPAPSSPSPA